MTCDDWLCWPGWTAVGSIAGVLALITLGFAINELRVRRKRVRGVVWGFDLFGTMTGGAESYHLGELHNGGSGTASITLLSLVNARPVPTPDFRYRSVIGPGESSVIPISAKNIADAWLVIIWTEDSDATLVRVEWLPVAEIGNAATAWSESFDRTRSLGRFGVIPAGRRPRPVGPGYYQKTSYRWSRRPKVAEARFKKTWAGMPAVAKTMFPWSYAANAPVADLPYVEPVT